MRNPWGVRRSLNAMEMFTAKLILRNWLRTSVKDVINQLWKVQLPPYKPNGIPIALNARYEFLWILKWFKLYQKKFSLEMQESHWRGIIFRRRNSSCLHKMHWSLNFCIHLPCFSSPSQYHLALDEKFVAFVVSSFLAQFHVMPLEILYLSLIYYYYN